MPVLDTLRKQLSCEPLKSATDIVVAYSGGVDSHVLLHALHRIMRDELLNVRLSAIHIHHGLSQHADEWQRHCMQVCEQLNVVFQTANVAVTMQPRQSLEAQARDARYNKLVELAPENSQVVLGQHQDDQLETFLLQLKRGAGPKGLSAMNRAWTAVCSLSPHKMVGFCRPLLELKQQDILDYAHQHELLWCEDESNQDIAFERNFLRHDVLPILTARWPEISRAVARSAALCAEQQSLLDEVCAEKLAQLQASTNSLDLAALKALSSSWLHQLVRYWLSTLGIQSPSLVVLNQLKSQVLDAGADANPILQWQGWQFRRFNEQLFVIAVKPLIHKQSIAWQGEAHIELPADMGALQFSHSNLNQADCLLLDTNLGDIEIQFGCYSQRFTPKGAAHSKPLKQWFKLWCLPPWERNQVVLLKQDGRLIGLLIQGKWHTAQDYVPVSDESVAVRWINLS